MPLETTFLLSVAAKLLTEWRKRVPAERRPLLPSDLAVADGILNLVNRYADLADVLKGATSVDKVVRDAVENAVTRFQRQIGGLEEDGILGTRTLSELMSLFGCHRKKQSDPQPLRPNFEMRDGNGHVTDELWFLYFVESTPNTVTDAHKIIDRAWNHWQEWALVRHRAVDRPEDANVIIRKAFIDGTGPILGQAHVGPPSGVVLELEMDDKQNWTAPKFEGAICHEIGHILGLSHSSPGNLMSEVIPDGVIKPTSHDGQRAAALAHLGPPPRRAPLPDRSPIPADVPPDLRRLLEGL